MPGVVRRIAGLFLAGLLAACAPKELPRLSAVYLHGVPNLSQNEALFDARFDPQTLCAPVAVANSLVWLEGRTGLEYQVAMVNRLADYRYMLTRPLFGTSPRGVLRGVRRYLREQGTEYAALRYVGWRDVDDADRDARTVQLTWLHESINERSALWLNLGWYRERLPGVYARTGGHWVTAVGYDNGALQVHDPLRNLPVTLPLTRRGPIVIDAAGWRLLEDTLLVPGRPEYPGEVGLVDGAVRLELPPGPEVARET